MNALHLIWIVPMAMLAGALLFGMFLARIDVEPPKYGGYDEHESNRRD